MGAKFNVVQPPSPEWTGFFEVPGILLLRLMSRCNEKCLFCMVADEIERSDDVQFDEAVRRIEAQPPGTQIEFFGGEPTIYPRFLDLLRIARQLGHPCSIASNIRIFHSRRFTDRVAELDPSQIYIRTSIYGDTPELHDYYTAAAGSFAQTLQGVKNIVAAGFPSQVNVVIMRGNYHLLPRFADAVHAWGVKRIKFGSLISVEQCAEHAVEMNDVRPFLCEAIDRAERLGLQVTVEKTPICVIDGRVDLLSTERVIYGSARTYDDAGPCGSCLVRRWCDGLDCGYARQFGTRGLQSVTTVPHAVVRRSQSGPFDPELLKTYCVEIDDEQLDELTMRELQDIWSRVNARHGVLAVFPSRFIRKAAPVRDIA
jgi:molybdenum cofactor biosynthesis enzyme MoaA